MKALKFFTIALGLTALMLGRAMADDPVKPADAGPTGPKAEDSQVDWTEIGRWGDRVSVSGEGPRDGGELMLSMALAPPEAEDDMWFVSVFGREGCEVCKGLVKAFETDAHLTPFVATPPGGKKKAWAHFNFYKVEDTSQKFRFEKYKISADSDFPITIIQPPRNGNFGNPAWVVDRIEKMNDPAKLQKRISRSVGAYCKKLQDGGFVPPAKAVEKFYGHGQPASDTGDSYDSPWKIPAATPFNPSFPNFPPEGPAAPTVLTLEQLQAACPDATPEFLTAQLTAKASDVNAVKLAWMVAKKNTGPGMFSGIGGFFTTATDWLLGLKAQTLLMLLITGLLAFQQYAKTTPGTVDDQAAAIALGMARYFQSSNGPAPLNPLNPPPPQNQNAPASIR